jgi:hypothetical protein
MVNLHSIQNNLTDTSKSPGKEVDIDKFIKTSSKD